MISFILEYQLYIKLIHLLAVFSWMAGLFYLPRIFVYHRETEDAQTKKTLNVMAEKLYRIIMTPAMHTTLLTGFLLFLLPYNITAGWLHLKIACVFSLIMFQFYLNRCRHYLAADVPYKSGKFFRLINEFPTLILIIILVCVVFKPF